MRRIVAATDNPDKLREFKAILGGAERRELDVVGMRQAGFAGGIVEDGKTFAENARIKARAVHGQLGGWVLADDSGLCVEALGGEPGVYSARFGGFADRYPAKFALLRERLSGVPPEQREAAFVCALALIRPDGQMIESCADCRGILIDEPRGSGGFGYDPIFLIPNLGLTLAEVDPEVKNRISHRAQALRQLSLLLCR